MTIFSQNYKETPYWHDGLDINASSIDEIPTEADAIIIGAGFTGLTVALRLLQAGKSVVLFDAQKLGEGASGKNGGMIGPSLHKLGLEGLKSIHGEEKAMAILQEGIHAINHMPKFIEEEGIDCDLNLSGRFTGVQSAKQWEQLKRNCDNFSKLDGFQFEMVEPQDTRQEIASDMYKGGVVYGLDGSLQPYKLVKGLAEKVIALGGKIFENCPVGAIYRAGNSEIVEHGYGTTKSDKLVIATNGYSKKFENKVTNYFAKRVLPLTSAMIATEQLPKEEITRLFPHNRVHGGNHRLVQYYRPSPDGTRILFGARGVDFWDRGRINGKNLHDLMCKIFPEMSETKIDFSWSGKVAYTFDHGPHIGEHDGRYYAMGYCGSGVTRSVYLATKLAKQILGEDDYRTAFHDISFDSKPFYNGKPWFMPIIIKWHSFMDQIE